MIILKHIKQKMRRRPMKQITKDYIKWMYEDYSVDDSSEKNMSYDYNLSINSGTISVELKEQFIENKESYDNDLMLEVIQNLPRFRQFRNKQHVNTDRVQQMFDPTTLFSAIGWMFKCNADRLVYVKMLSADKKNISQAKVLDIDYRLFRDWIFTNLGNKAESWKDKKKLTYCGDTSGSILLRVDENEIPSVFCTITDIKILKNTFEKNDKK